MRKFTNLPNIGSTLAQKLKMIGVNNENDLRAMGSVKAIIKISALKNSGACINMLYAIEGAIQGIRWHNLSKERKQELLEFYKKIKL